MSPDVNEASASRVPKITRVAESAGSLFYAGKHNVRIRGSQFFFKVTLMMWGTYEYCSTRRHCCILSPPYPPRVQPSVHGFIKQALNCIKVTITRRQRCASCQIWQSSVGSMFLNSHLTWNGAFIYTAGGVKCLWALHYSPPEFSTVPRQDATGKDRWRLWPGKQITTRAAVYLNARRARRNHKMYLTTLLMCSCNEQTH